MDLRTTQHHCKDGYRADPGSASITLTARGSETEGPDRLLDRPRSGDPEGRGARRRRRPRHRRRALATCCSARSRRAPRSPARWWRRRWRCRPSGSRSSSRATSTCAARSASTATRRSGSAAIRVRFEVDAPGRRPSNGSRRCARSPSATARCCRRCASRRHRHGALRREGRRRRAARPAARRAARARTRPTADRVREALFSILGDVSGARVLDLSPARARSASRRSRAGPPRPCSWTARGRAVAAIRRNLGGARAGGRGAAPRRARVPRAPRTAATRYDLVFCDPPYDSALRRGSDARGAPPAAPHRDAVIVTESDKRAPLVLPFPLAARAHLRRHPDRGPPWWLSERRHGRLPGLLRPGHARPPRHHQPRRARVRQRGRRGRRPAGAQEEDASSRAEERVAFIEARGRKTRQCAGKSLSITCSSTSPGRTGPRRSSRGCGRSRTSSTSSR